MHVSVTPAATQGATPRRTRLARRKLHADTMRSAWRIGSALGITVQVHWTFLILLSWVALAHGMSGGGVAAAGRGALLLVLFFATIAERAEEELRKASCCLPLFFLCLLCFSV